MRLFISIDLKDGAVPPWQLDLAIAELMRLVSEDKIVASVRIDSIVERPSIDTRGMN